MIALVLMDMPRWQQVARFFFLVLLCAAAGIWTGWRLTHPTPRTIDSTRIESTLQAYIDHRHDGNDQQLQQRLSALSLSPRQFERIIDRFIHYRMRQSSMKQAMVLLDAFKAGYRIAPENAWFPDEATASFALDAEILTVIQKRPELVSAAFGG